MSTITLKRIFLPMLSALALTSCFSPAEDNADAIDESAATTRLKVTTRAASGAVTYPILVMAYDESGALKGEQTINSESDEISLKLSEGAYHITALSGQGTYTEPSSYNQQSALINIPTAGYASSPLMMGGADVLLTSASAKVNVVMIYRVASLSLSLESVPEDVSAVSVGVSQQYKAIDMSGTFSGSSTANVKCTKTGDVWTSEQVFLLPGAGSSTTLTLSLTNAEGQTSYSYELSEPLMAAVPYTIKGTYVESTAPYITGVITIEGWQEERSFDFEFGSGSSSGGAGVVTPTNDVTAIPEPSSLWNGHIVALVDNATSTEADVLLLGLREMKNVFAPAAEGHETQMQDSVQAYFENDMKDWAVPTEEQARALKKQYGGNFDELNLLIEQQKGDTLHVYTSSSNARYLCEEGTKTFNFAANGSITSAGTSTKYRLRLVKKIHVIVKNN